MVGKIILTEWSPLQVHIALLIHGRQSGPSVALKTYSLVFYFGFTPMNDLLWNTPKSLLVDRKANNVNKKNKQQYYSYKMVFVKHNDSNHIPA